MSKYAVTSGYVGSRWVSADEVMRAYGLPPEVCEVYQSGDEPEGLVLRPSVEMGRWLVDNPVERSDAHTDALRCYGLALLWWLALWRVGLAWAPCELLLCLIGLVVVSFLLLKGGRSYSWHLKKSILSGVNPLPGWVGWMPSLAIAGFILWVGRRGIIEMIDIFCKYP